MKSAFRPLAALFAAVFFAAVPAAALAQAYPSKPIKLIVPFPAGGSLDSTSRLLAEKLAASLGQPVVVENRAGAGGNIGMDAVAKSAPDGHTIGMGALSTHAVNPSLVAKMPYDANKDFTPISNVVVTPNVLLLHPSVPANDVQSFIAYAKANPGKLAFGSGSNGSGGHMAGERLKSMYGLDMIHVPYKGGAPATAALLAGDVQFSFDNLASSLANVKAGKFKALAVTTPARSELAANVPTMSEAGVKDFDIYTWWGLFAPAGVSKDIVQKLNEHVTRALAAPDLKEKFVAMGAAPSPTTPEAFAAFIRAEQVKYAKIVKDSGAKVD
jgi:tripartite-type tricarboxylate transporter receptor subunit TctC